MEKKLIKVNFEKLDELKLAGSILGDNCMIQFPALTLTTYAQLVENDQS